MIAPAGLAAASEGSVPGDTLYPVKQLSERVLVLFDSEVIARHRLEEIETLEALVGLDPDFYDDARAALTELGEDHALWERLASPSTADHADSDESDESGSMTTDDDDRSDGEAVEPERVTLQLPDGSEAGFVVAGNQLVEVDLPTGWLVAELDEDEATLMSDDYEVEVQLLDDGSLSAEVTRQTADDDDDSASTSVGDAQRTSRRR